MAQPFMWNYPKISSIKEAHEVVQDLTPIYFANACLSWSVAYF